MFILPSGTLQQKTTGGMFGQSPMLGGGVNTGGNVLGTGLFNQANTTGGGGGIFGNKPQTSSGLQLGQSAGSLQLGQSAGGLQLGQSTGGLQLGQTPGGLQLGQTTGGLGGLQTGGGMFGKISSTLVIKGWGCFDNYSLFILRWRRGDRRGWSSRYSSRQVRASQVNGHTEQEWSDCDCPHTPPLRHGLQQLHAEEHGGEHTFPPLSLTL